MILYLVVLLVQLLLLKKDVTAKDQIGMTWICDCRFNFDTHNASPLETDCLAYGISSMKLEHDHKAIFWSLSNGALTDIVNKCFLPHNTTLTAISLQRLQYLDEFDKLAFTNLRNIESISVSQAPALRYLPNGVFYPVSSNLRVLRMSHTGLERVPLLPSLTKKIMHLIDFESNNIKIIQSNSINIQTEQLLLAYNSITKIESWAFNGSSIGKLNLRGNRGLTDLTSDSFRGLKSLSHLDLSETAITFLPVAGLELLESLRIHGTTTLKTIPSIYDLKSLRVAELTYSFHCCAFKYPSRHNPARHELHVEYLARVKELCSGSNKARFSSNNKIGVQMKRQLGDTSGQIPIDINESENSSHLTSMNFSQGVTYKSLPTSQSVGVLDGLTEAPITKKMDSWGESSDLAHTQAPSPAKFYVFCGNLTRRKERFVKCWPLPDALNPCEDIMGYEWLRISVWLVISTALIGNTAVLVVLLANRSDTTVPRFLMMNLAFSDLLMAVYLLLLASTDLQSTGIYFNFAFDWQRGYGCKIAGVLTVFSSQLSIYTLTLITVERWFAIRHALYANVIDLKVASQAMVIGWFYSIAMAVLPLFGISSYSTTSICLPMDVQNIKSTIYVLTLLIMTGLAFVAICICYIQIYLSLGEKTRQCPGESSIARKMMLLVGTNFACWAPIAFFSLTAVAGYPLIDVTRSKILLVFFYPINSCANPYLYAIMTAQYRKQFIQLLSRCGLCTEFAQQYKMVYQPQNEQKARPSRTVLISTSHGTEDAV